MYSQMRSSVVFGVMLALAAAFASCGGGNPKESRIPEDGRILLRNDTRFTLRVEYKSERLGLTRTEVKPGDTQIVTGDDLIKGGTKVVLTVVTVVSGGGMPLTQEVAVVIDGNVTVLATPTGRRGVKLTVTVT